MDVGNHGGGCFNAVFNTVDGVFNTGGGALSGDSSSDEVSGAPLEIVCVVGTLATGGTFLLVSGSACTVCLAQLGDS